MGEWDVEPCYNFNMKKDIKFIYLLLTFAVITALIVFILFPYLDKDIGIDTSYDRTVFSVPYIIVWGLVFAYYGLRKLFIKRV